MFSPAVFAQPIPVPAPRGDPLGALLNKQVIEKKEIYTPIAIGLQLDESAARSRLTLELSDPVEARIFTLSAPNRVVIDLPELLWRLPEDARPTGKRAVKSYRYGQFRKGNSRLVLDLNRPVKAGAPKMLQPEAGSGFRLVIDLTPASGDEFLAQAGWPKDLQTPVAPVQSGVSAGIAQYRKPLIVLDAGHGGVDPGTHGQSGTVEKDLVLSVAKELKKTLEKTGAYSVQLTREGDVFVPLRERVNIARSARADLFISLHADSNDHREIRGASVYTLSEDASDREAATLAEKENMSDIIAGVDLSGENNPVATILIDLVQRDTLNRSMRLAETLVGTLQAATAVQTSSPHRSAGFAVLKAPDIPAVLIELGYLTNRMDEAEMVTDAWRGRVSRAISGAIETHFAKSAGTVVRQAAAP